MNQYVKYIKERFSNELKLLIFLSQDELGQYPFSGNLNEIDWDEFVNLTVKHRLVSHVLKHSAFLADNIPIPTYEKLIEIRLEHSKKSLNYAIHAIRIHQKLTENNIPHCFFKGPLLSLELYKDVGYRNFGDIDFLVEKSNVKKTSSILEELDFKCIYPKIILTEKQKRINYRLSHHYHFTHPVQPINIELHWSITNPKTFFDLETNQIISNSRKLKVSNYQLSYISKIDNMVYQAAHGSIHQWYRLFWLKDFSRLIVKSSPDDIKKAFELSKNLKLQKCFIQACLLSHLIYKTDLPDFANFDFKKNLIKIPLNSIHINDLSQQGVKGKMKFVFYRLQLKADFRYYFELIYRLRTHLSDWELLKLPKSLFFLYYVLRPFFLIYKFLIKRRAL
ncbi:MAG: nucleotidyltransferase family protein [Bacteroidales bacterium]|nr:nucleotidyltransferase family protein [Bacteroidales bacterium]